MAVQLSILRRGWDNSKTKKSMIKNNVLICILYLVPYREKTTGHVICKKSTPECRRFCLAHHAGFNFSRLHKADAWKHSVLKIKAPEVYWKIVKEDTASALSEACKLGVKLLIRPDGIGECYAEEDPYGQEFLFFCADNGIDLYGYTADINRIEFTRKRFSHYRLVFSYKKIFGIKRKWSPEACQNEKDAITAINLGANLACIFDVPKGDDLPEEVVMHGRKLEVHDGDQDDLLVWKLYDSPKPCVIGLRLKGNQKWLK